MRAVDAGPDEWGIVGVSRAIEDLREQIRTFGPTDRNVLILGPTGTGKELVAQALHKEFGRGRLVVANSAGLAPTLIESQLFGHIRGSFTGADRSQSGLFEESDGGSLFLDEIGELPLDLQAKLLRAVEQGEVLPVGATRPHAISVRVISATNRDLHASVVARSFREDLFYRLGQVIVQISPLRDRPEDIPHLVRYFASGVEVSAQAIANLEKRPWRGNVRELRDAIANALVLSRGTTVTDDLLASRWLDRDWHSSLGAPHPVIPHAVDRAREGGQMRYRNFLPVEIERTRIIDALRAERGVKTEAAARLGMVRKTLYDKLKQHDILPPEYLDA